MKTRSPTTYSPVPIFIIWDHYEHKVVCYCYNEKDINHITRLLNIHSYIVWNEDSKCWVDEYFV